MSILLGAAVGVAALVGFVAQRRPDVPLGAAVALSRGSGLGELDEFGNLQNATASELPPGHPRIDDAPAAHAHGAPASSAEADGPPDIEVSRARGSNARSIGELHAQSSKLQGKLWRVRGQVVKVTPGVLGKTYLRLRDGSSTHPEQRELVVTSHAEAQVGVVATFEGTLRTQVDVGIGFVYPVLLEDAKVVPEPPAL